ncbi:hypothetical protein AAG570_002344 [Ranatra chinensis]|uniref:K Homology domain-containing protein n=1 Tax=Ranatra chinensis TaxID=642074 RepID=A0ABD0Y795_9HEMI
MTTSRAASSSGTSSSIASSREDLDDLATLLGLPSAESLVQERFRVDRRSLETLMFGKLSYLLTLLIPVENIMQATRTHITWPSRLKLGAKSKKDPHIKVIGRSDDVQIARNEILASLDTRASRVTMKIDVSYTDHSHIIGKAGLTIKSVMDETGCHIHFPDSNRTNLIEKSNQVSIAGDVAGVEKARAKVRELTPLIFCFDLPILGVLKMSPDPSSPYIKSLQEAYNVQVSLRSRQKLNSTQVVVKGCEWEVEKVKEATQLLISHMCDSLASQVLVQMMIEISPQHHSIVLGRNNECLRGIMQRTSTQIVFLDPNDPNILPLKKSNVTITGSIHNVYLARQQLIGSLPVALMFEAPDRSTVVPSEQINHLMNNLDVVITTKYRQKQNNVSFIVRGIERNINNIYEARRRLVAQNEPPIEVNVPSNYMIPNAGPTFKNSWQLLNENLFRIYPNIPSPLMITPVLGRVGEPLWSPAPHSYHMLPFPPYHVPVRGFSPTTTQPLLMDHLGHFSYSSLSLPDLPGLYNSILYNPSSVSSPSASPRAVSPVHHISSDSTLTKAGTT